MIGGGWVRSSSMSANCGPDSGRSDLREFAQTRSCGSQVLEFLTCSKNWNSNSEVTELAKRVGKGSGNIAGSKARRKPAGATWALGVQRRAQGRLFRGVDVIPLPVKPNCRATQFCSHSLVLSGSHPPGPTQRSKSWAISRTSASRVSAHRCAQVEGLRFTSTSFVVS